MDEILIHNMTAIGIIVIFLSLLFLPKFWRYLCNGILLLLISITALLYVYELIDYNIMLMPITRYFLMLIIILEGRNLLVEGVKEHKGVLKFLTIFIGIFLIINTMAPELYRLGAISFDIPEIPINLLYFIYAFAGILLFIGAFLINKN